MTIFGYAPFLDRPYMQSLALFFHRPLRKWNTWPWTEFQRVGLREKYGKPPRFHGKSHGFRFRFSLPTKTLIVFGRRWDVHGLNFVNARTPSGPSGTWRYLWWQWLQGQFQRPEMIQCTTSLRLQPATRWDKRWRGCDGWVVWGWRSMSKGEQ